MLEWVALVVAVVLLYKWLTQTPAGFPPGPPSWPIVGAFPYLKGKFIHHTLFAMGERYGPVVGMRFGMFINAVSITGPLVIEGLKKEEFQGRNKTVRGQKPRPGIIFKDGDHWREQRRFTLRHLRDFGFGKSSTESIIMEEAEECFRMRLRGKDKVQVVGLFGTSAVNVLWAMMGGKRFDYEDQEFTELLDILRESFRTDNISLGFLKTLPIVRKLFPKWSGAHDQEALETTLKKYFQRQINEHSRTLTDTPRDFMDVYLLELQKEKLAESFNEDTLMAVCLDLFTAGAESSSNTLSFCILYLVLYPQWQERLYKEIMEVLGSNVAPSLAEKNRLPSVDAFITEVTRASTIAPITPPRRCTKDTYFNGHFIPKDSFMFFNLWSVLTDKDHWGDPEAFRPDRFIDSDGNYKADNFMINFGIGPRQCAGESLARSFIFVFLVVLVREFRFEAAKGEAPPSVEPADGLTQAPQPFCINPVPRSQP